jgi:hypothetical protein
MGVNARGVAQCDSGHGDYPDACNEAEGRACARCGVEYPFPVEYHHTEQECESAWEADGMTAPASGRVPSFVNEVIDCGALLGHVEAALAVVDRMNAKRAEAVTAETRRLLAHIAAEVDQRIGDLIEGDPHV